MTPPRRWKLESEYDDVDREEVRRPGHPGRVERAEYTRWRHETLKRERDDLGLRLQLLREEAEILRARAAGRDSQQLDAMSVEDHMADMARPWDEPRHVDDTSRDEREKAAELEQEADEIDRHLAEVAESDPAQHLERIQGNRR